MQNKGKYYITTAIAYTSGKPHIGNTYEIILADCIARYKKADGYDGVCCVEYMAKAGVHGEEHSLYLDTYVRNIRAYWEGEEIRPPYGTIPGLDKPVSRIFFGTAIRPMLTG